MILGLSHKIKGEHKVIIISILAAIGLWFFDAFVDSYIFLEGAFIDSLIHASGHEMYFRTFMLTVFSVFAFLTSRIFKKHRITEEKLKQAISSVNAEKAKTDSIISAIGDGISIQNRDFKVLYQNEVHKSMIGDHHGKYCYKAYENKEAVCEGCPIAKVFEQGMPYKTTRSTSTDKGILYVEIIASPLRDTEGHIYAAIETVRDITKRIESQILLSEQSNLTELRASIGIALTGSKGLDEMLQHCCEAFVNHLDAAFARIWILDKLLDNLELQASAGIYTHIDGKHSRIPVGKYKIGLIAKEKKPYMSNNLIGDPLIHNQEWVKKSGIKAFAGYPFIIFDNVIGVMAIFSSKPLSEITFQSLESISDEIALGINHKLAEEALEKHRHHLKGLVKEKTADLSSAINLLKDEIKQRRIAEEALRLSESKYRDLYDNAPDMYHTLNEDKIIIDCNDTDAEMLGYSKDELIGKPLEIFFTEEFRKSLDSDFLALKDKGALYNLERTFIRKDGTTFPVIINVFANLDENGEMTGTRSIARDITELKMAQAETMRASHLASLGELAAGVAHEINNPINGIINYAEILSRKSAQGSREKDVASRIITEGDRIANIVRSLLSFAKDNKEEKYPVHVYIIMSESLALTETQIRKDGINLKINIPRNLPPIIAHPQQIEQVFLNILSNARYSLNEKYNGEDENKILEITCSTISIDNTPYIRTVFHDQGTGIPANIMDKIMNPFFSTKSGNVGTGLGLSISHGIVSDHKGKMVFDSTEGEFTKVQIDLPAHNQAY